MPSKQRSPPEPEPELPAFTGAPTFDNYVGALFALRCAECHTNDGAAEAQLDFSSYASTMEGSEDAPVILPGDSANSLIVKIQSKKHFVNLTADELTILIQWITDGALEK